MRLDAPAADGLDEHEEDAAAVEGGDGQQVGQAQGDADDAGNDTPPVWVARLHRVFGRFYRADDARSRAHGGAGLGLSIARWIAAIHRGEIDVDSELGGGTTFRVRVPITAKRIETAMTTGKIPASI